MNNKVSPFGGLLWTYLQPRIKGKAPFYSFVHPENLEGEFVKFHGFPNCLPSPCSIIKMFHNSQLLICFIRNVSFFFFFMGPCFKVNNFLMVSKIFNSLNILLIIKEFTVLKIPLAIGRSLKWGISLIYFCIDTLLFSLSLLLSLLLLLLLCQNAVNRIPTFCFS